MPRTRLGSRVPTAILVVLADLEPARSATFAAQPRPAVRRTASWVRAWSIVGAASAAMAARTLRSAARYSTGWSLHAPTTPIRCPRTLSGAAMIEAIVRSAALARRSAATSLTISASPSRTAPRIPAPALPRRFQRAPGGPQEEEAGPAGRQAAGLPDGHRGDRGDLERRPDLVGEVVDEVQLAVALEGLLGEGPLVVHARGRGAEDRRDRRRDAPALDPADGLAIEEDRKALALIRDGAAP